MAEYAWFKDPLTGRETYRRVRDEAPKGAGPAFIRDDMNPVKSMVDGKTYTSKSELRRSYNRHGYIEAGGEDIAKHYPKPKEPARVRETIERAFARAGMD